MSALISGSRHPLSKACQSLLRALASEGSRGLGFPALHTSAVVAAPDEGSIPPDASASATGDAASADGAQSAAETQPQLTPAQRAAEVKHQKREHAKRMSQLRKQWAAERAEADQQRRLQREETERMAQLEQEKQLAASMARREEEKRQRAVIEAEAAAWRAQERAEGDARRRATQHVYDLYKLDRRNWLEEQSRNWVTADQLNARIDWALNHPQPLGGNGAQTFAQVIAANQKTAAVQAAEAIAAAQAAQAANQTSEVGENQEGFADRQL
mmetsp:Transcript_1629/g.4772  ORF Transcript_1629/g.4772 Transcript_1629/m.4772 type:complete len:271 (+) Transcript_1629:174-986(+)